MRMLKTVLMYSFLLILPLIIELVGYIRLISILAYSYIMSIYALSFALLMWDLGLLNFGHAVFLGMGAYFTTYMLLWYGLPYAVAIAVSMAVGALLGLIIALTAKKIFYGMQFAFYALTVLLIVYFLYRKREFRDLGGGEQGIVVPIPDILKSDVIYPSITIVFILLAIISLILINIKWKTSRNRTLRIIINTILISYFLVMAILLWNYSGIVANKIGAFRLTPNLYALSLTLLILVYLLCARIRDSAIGAIWTAIRDNPIRMEVIGYNSFMHKTMGLVIAGSLAGLAGSLYAPYVFNVSPDKVLAPLTSIYGLVYCIIGGVTTLIGPIVGAIVVTLLELLIADYLRGYSLILVGMAFIAIVIAAPHGLAPYVLKLKDNIVKKVTSSLKIIHE